MSPVPATAATRSLLRVPARARVSRRAALAALVTALVLGILGMHALASHGTPATPAAAPAVTAMTGHESAHEAALAAGASHDTHTHYGTHADAHDRASTAAGHGSSDNSGHDMTSMAMLCVAMLAGAALTVVLLLVLGVRRPLLPAAFAPAAVRERVLQWVRGTGPPPVWQFSVIRC